MRLFNCEGEQTWSGTLKKGDLFYVPKGVTYQFKSKTQKPGKLPTKSGYTVLLELSNGKNNSW